VRAVGGTLATVPGWLCVGYLWRGDPSVLKALLAVAILIAVPWLMLIFAVRRQKN
jgi:hypothetical protein